MSIAILIAALNAYGQLSFDLSHVAGAMERTLDSLRKQSLRCVHHAIDNPDGRKRGDPNADGAWTSFHAVTSAGHYYETKTSDGKKRVTCFSNPRSFQVKNDTGTWELSALPVPEQEERYFNGFAVTAFLGFLNFDGQTLSSGLQDSREFSACCLPLGRNRKVIWGRFFGSKPNNNTNHLSMLRGHIRFRAIVNLSNSSRLAFFEWSDYLVFNLNVAIHVTTKSNARFEAERLECQSLDQTGIVYPECKTDEEIAKCQTAKKLRSRIDFQTDADVKDDQLTPAYYGIDDETILMHGQRADSEARAKSMVRPPTQPTPRYNSEQLDLTIAIGIPVVLLGVLLIVIRKT